MTISKLHLHVLVIKSAGHYYGPATSICITLKNRSFVTNSLGGEGEQIMANGKNTDLQGQIHYKVK